MAWTWKPISRTDSCKDALGNEPVCSVGAGWDVRSSRKGFGRKGDWRLKVLGRTPKGLNYTGFCRNKVTESSLMDRVEQLPPLILATKHSMVLGADHVIS